MHFFGISFILYFIKLSSGQSLFSITSALFLHADRAGFENRLISKTMENGLNIAENRTAIKSLSLKIVQQYQQICEARANSIL